MTPPDVSPLVDVRAEADFVLGHAPAAAGIPLEELAGRTHELPPREAPVCVTDADPRRAEEAAAFLRLRGHAVTVVGWDPAAATESGPSHVRLWGPNPFLVEAVERIGRERAGAAANPGRALDLACGCGRDAVWLALQGYQVDAIDVLPDALRRTEDLARRSGVRVHTARQDLEREPNLGRGSYDLVTVFRFLHRDLFPAVRAAVAPGGYVAYETFHERNRETGKRPLSPEHRLQTGELARAFGGFDVLIARDAVERSGRFFSAILARRPPK